MGAFVLVLAVLTAAGWWRAWSNPRAVIFALAGLALLAATTACTIHYVDVSVTAPPPTAPQPPPRDPAPDAGARD